MSKEKTSVSAIQSDYSWLQHVAIVDDDGWQIRGTEEQLDEIMRLARFAAQSKSDFSVRGILESIRDYAVEESADYEDCPVSQMRFATIASMARDGISLLSETTRQATSGDEND